MTSRVTIDFPQAILYREVRDVGDGEMNHGNHLGFEKAVALIAEARVRCFERLGLTDVDPQGAGIIVADLAVRYRAEIRGGDRLILEVAAGNPEAKRCDLFYRFVREGDGRPAVEAKTGIVFFDYASRRVADMPARFRERFFGPGANLPRPPAPS
jgi:4-hydroxybenzoyl-CoA thioesterase